MSSLCTVGRKATLAVKKEALSLSPGGRGGYCRFLVGWKVVTIHFAYRPSVENKEILYAGTGEANLVRDVRRTRSTFNLGGGSETYLQSG